MRPTSPKHICSPVQKIKPMSAPRPKRQFAGAASDPAQRHITSFFTTNTTTSSSSPNSNFIGQTSSLLSTTQHPDSTPNLPASVQANLLSVGMRIRKSVPEGYKTGNYSAFALWDENDACPATAVTMGEGQRSRANAFSSPRELLPFCGIHKVGGLDTQLEDHYHMPSIPSINTSLPTTPPYQPSSGVEGANMYDSMPRLTRSRESVESNTSSISLASGSTGARTLKRVFVEEEENEAPGQLNLWRHNHDISVSPHSLTPVGWNNSGRAMAVPRKGRLRGKNMGATIAMPNGGQENLMVTDSDFEEAEFLDQGTWEVDMNDT
ncbi:hypothetical protein HD806DRAFT_485356 [Xylariaceae sp. AK1471]|nr:hypothetical protein HD806DRAFT_485356 [Xylariaceae sp. AK1471]